MLYGILAVLAALVIWGGKTYNGLIRLRNQVGNAWAQIDVQLKRRHDLIPNLVETAKGYMKHERETLDSVVSARAKAVNANGPREAGAAESELSGALSRLLMIVENYPDLKANENFLVIQEELVSTENKVSFARQFYNDIVLQLNNLIQSVPSNIVANLFGFRLAEFFEIEIEAERDVPKVSFD